MDPGHWDAEAGRTYGPIGRLRKMKRNMRSPLLAASCAAALALVSQACGGSSNNSPQCNPACPAGQTCVYETGTTRTACQSSTGTACTTDAQCLNGQTCQSGVCKPKTLGCTSDSQCPTGQTCQSGACKAAGTPCSTDAQCLNGQTCQSGVCKPKTLGCTSDSQCPTGQTCQSGACKAAGTPCSTDAQCLNGQTCQSGVCKPKTLGCTSDSQCPTGQTCQSGACKAPAGCTSDSQCPLGNRCNNGQCMTTTTGPQTCLDIINCMSNCQDSTCKSTCISSASSAAQATLQALVQCDTTNTCNSDSVCLQQKCPSQYSVCTPGSTGGKTCTDLVRCWVDSTCDIDAAYDAAPADARSQFMIVVQCTNDHSCTTGQCIQDNCTAELNACP
jgi:Cys-rich repeat protein